MDKDETITLRLRPFAQLLPMEPSARLNPLRRIKHGRNSGPPYHREARQLIPPFVAGELSKAEIIRRAEELEKASKRASKPYEGHRLLNNARMLDGFVRRFDRQGIELLDQQMLALDLGGIVVTMRPELHYMRAGQENFTKLIFASKPPGPRPAVVNQWMSHLLFDMLAQRQGPVAAAGELYGVLRGTSAPAAQASRAIAWRVPALVEQIVEAWPSLKPYRPRDTQGKMRGVAPSLRR